MAGLSALAVLAVAGAAIVILQRSSLTRSIDDTLRQRADDIEALIDEGGLPEDLPARSSEGFIQVVDGDLVIAATPNLLQRPPLALAAGPAGDRLVTTHDLPIDDDSFRVLIRSLSSSVVLYVGTTYDVVGESTFALLGALALAIPVVLAALCILTWWMVGRTLEPVEAIRAEVADIGSDDLHRRVPLPHTRDEIDDLAGTMNQMLERIETSTNRQRRFVSDASHELRTPLTRIRSELELTLAGTDEAVTIAALGSMLAEVVEMQAIVEDLLYLARSDADPVGSPAREVDLDDIVLREAGHVAADSGLRVDVSAVSAANVIGDASALSRAVRNLVDNAARHATTTVRFALHESHGWAELTIADDGPGIPEEGAELVFERFGRLDLARSANGGGSGLGLAIAREIVSAHGGTLRLINPGRGGAIFEMRLPLNVPHRS